MQFEPIYVLNVQQNYTTYFYTFKIIHVVSNYINGMQIVWIPSNSKLY
jgi:hypothetical protein